VPKAFRIGLLVLLLVAMYLLGYHLPRHSGFSLFLVYSLAFGAYVLWMRTPSWKAGFLVAIALRLVLLFSFPGLSDDVYRFLWDGQLLVAGESPYAKTPHQWMEAPHTLPQSLDDSLYAHLNSPGYFSVYPPVAQLVFYLAARAGGGIMGGMLLIRLLLVLAEAASIWLLGALLCRYGKRRETALWYALNPLVMIEITGNLHFEGFMIFFVLLAVYLLPRKRYGQAPGAMALAVGVKLLPLMYLPAVWKALGFRRGLLWMLWLGLITVLLILPFFGEEFLGGMAQSLDLYVRKFEFNAGLYYLLRDLGYLWKGYNLIQWIGPALSLTALVGILFYVARADIRETTLLPSFFFIHLIYLLSVTTFHPWYLCPLIAFSLFSRYRFPVVWSFLIFFTYLGYSATGFEEVYGVVAMEYGLTLLVAVGEWKKWIPEKML
jgi:alpha-1,6-mannosyltransferase